MISTRGKMIIGEPAPLVVNHFKCAADKFCPDTNPGGKINLGTAENHLMDDEMLEMVNQPLCFSAQHLHYGLSHGTHSFRTAAAGLMEEISKVDDVDPANIVVAGGASAILESLSMTLFDEGECLIVPTPFYSGFIHDFCTRFHVRIVPYALSPHNGYELGIEGLKKRIEDARAEGIVVRAILLCSPNNPLGITYSKQKLEQIIETAELYDLDIISDEMYAGSVYQGHFTSMLGISKRYRRRIHVVYGFAKDFVLSGFKAGLLYSENEELLQAVQEIAYFHPVSTHTQYFLENMISNLPWCREFSRTNKAKLLNASSLIKKLLKEELNIQTVSANAGIFVWADFSDYLEEQSFAAELKLFEAIFNECHVSISPGQFFDASTPGWFRICFAQKEAPVATAVMRLQELLSQQHCQPVDSK